MVDPACAGAGRRAHLWPARSGLRLHGCGDLPHPRARAAARRRVGDEQPRAHEADGGGDHRGRSSTLRRHRARSPSPHSPSSIWATGRGSSARPSTPRKVGTHTLWFAPAIERAPNGESFVDLFERVTPAIDGLTAEHRGRDIVAVTHGGTIRAALALALGLDPQAALSLCDRQLLDHAARPPEPRPARRVCGGRWPSTTDPGPARPPPRHSATTPSPSTRRSRHPRRKARTNLRQRVACYSMPGAPTPANRASAPRPWCGAEIVNRRPRMMNEETARDAAALTGQPGADRRRAATVYLLILAFALFVVIFILSCRPSRGASATLADGGHDGLI